MKKRLFILLAFCPILSFSQLTQYVNYFDYKNINTQTFIPMSVWNDEQKYFLTILKHSFDMQRIIAHPKDTLFFWNGLVGEKTTYTRDSLVVFFFRAADTVTRPCILLTHGNNARYRSGWNETLNFYAIDLAMRGYCVAYYENPSSFEAKEINSHISGNFNQLLSQPRNAFYNGFQSSVAADLFVKHNASIFKVDTTKIFAGGFSFGAFCSLMLASADQGKNFTDSLFNFQGGYAAKSIYNDVYTKSIHKVFSIGGGLPKDDTLPVNNSQMGNFLDENDSSLSILLLHGRTDNFVSFDLTKFAEADTSTSFFWGEGPRAIINTIRQKNLAIDSKLFVNCRSGHSFLTQVCGYSNPYCLPQYQWLYLPEPPGDLSNTNTYFQNNLTDTLLHYFAYMMTQLNDVGFLIGDFLQPAILNTTSVFPNGMLYIEPQDSFTYVHSSGHYVLKNTDCEGHSLIITSVKEDLPGKDGLKIYPNPTHNFITVDAKEIIEKISIYSIVGALVKEIYGDKNAVLQIDLGGLPSGEYICSIQLKDKLITQKISVIRE